MGSGMSDPPGRKAGTRESGKVQSADGVILSGAKTLLTTPVLRTPLHFFPAFPLSRFPSCFLHVAYECLTLVDAHVGVAHHRGERVHHVALCYSLPAPVPGHPD